MSEKMVRNSGSNQQGTNCDNLTNPALESLVSEIMDLCAAPSSKRHELERLLSRYMKQEGDSAFSEPMILSNHIRNPENQIRVTEPRSLQLQFSTDICQPVFTGVPIKGKDHPLMVELIDGQSGKVVTFGPEASARVEIVVLEADFDECFRVSWTREEFKSKIITKEGTKRLLTENVVLDLTEGIGCVGTVQFSHTKTWKTKRAYRLGAIAMDDSMGTKIKEGFTDIFEVKDHRLDLNKKHYPPALSDEVWRLDSIAKDGAFHQRLLHEEVNIKTVEDFLNALNKDSLKLREILGKGMYAKNWEALVNHARTCIVDERLHLYSSSGSSVLFNMVGQVIGLFSELQYVSFEMLSESQKAHAMNLVASAFQQWDNVVSFSDEASFDKYWGPSNNVYHLELPMSESSSGIDILIPSKNDEIDLPQPAISFEDKASLFDESPMNTIIYPPNSPTIEISSGSKTLTSPQFDNLDFPQSAVFFNDKESLFDESPSLSCIIRAPKFPIKESSSGTQILLSQENNELGFPPQAFPFDDGATLFDEIPGPSDIICASESPITESCYGCNISISPEIDLLDFPESIVPSQEIIPNSDSVWDMSYYNDHNLQCADHTGHRHERRLSYSSQMTDSDNWEIIGPWLEENLQFSVDDVPLDTQGLILKSVDYPQNDGNGPIVTTYPTVAVNNSRKRYLRNKAKRNWKVLFSVMRWLFVCRNAAGKLPVGRLQVKLSFSYQDLQALDSFGGDFVIPTPFETKGFQILSSHAPVFSRNLSMKSEANLHSAVNDILLARSVALATNITQRKYMSKREKARRRWTKLYSVMKWFSVQRNVAKRASYALTVRGGPSSYDGYVSSWDMMCPNQQKTTSFTCPFYEDEYIQLFNTFCSLQPRNRTAMNRLARRRYAVDRGFAKRKWKMLFSIMKWLSLRRSAARVKGLYKNC